uniref:Serine/threonine-protein phosphatase n=1 Tax=Haemonchus contortus TaxID=6289 RepID=A0A7I4YUK2_HAECO
MQSVKRKPLVPKTLMPTLIDRMIRRITREGHLSGFTDEQVLSVLRDAKSSLEPQPATLEIDAPIVIFGDIHGQLRDLLRFFTIVGPPPQNKILFLGDYVDRCKKSFEVIMLLLCYRIKYPHLIHLLRGNHECSKMNRLYGFYEELRRKRCIYMWKKFQEVFNEMPLCAVVSSRLLCMHGGISPEIQNWDSLVTLQKPKTPRACDDGIAVDLMWSDPSTDSCTGFQFNAIRATSYIFGGDTIANICDMLDISMVVRAHEVVRGGHQFMYDRKLVTIFSAPNYCGTDGNAASVMRVSRRLEVSFVTLKPRLDTNRLTEEKRLLLEKMAADAMAKSPDPCARPPQEKMGNINDDCLIGPVATMDQKGVETQQRKPDVNLMGPLDGLQSTSATPKAPPATKDTLTPTQKVIDAPTAESFKNIPPVKSTGVETITPKKRDTTPAPMTPTKRTAQANAPAAPQGKDVPDSSRPSIPSTSSPFQARGQVASSIATKNDKTASGTTSKSSSGTTLPKRPTIALLYPYKPGEDTQASGKKSPAVKPATPISSKAVEISNQSKDNSINKAPVAGHQANPAEIRPTWPDSAKSGVKMSEHSPNSAKASPSAKAKSVEEATRTAIAATRTLPQPDPMSQKEIIDATEKALKSNNPPEQKK